MLRAANVRNRWGITRIRIDWKTKRELKLRLLRSFTIGTCFAVGHGWRILHHMSILNFRNTLKGLGLTSVFALGLIFVSSTSASAQYRQPGYYGNGGNNGYYGRDNDRRRKEERKQYERGFKQGEKDGKRDARDGRRGNRGIFNGGIFNRGGYGGGAYERGYQDGYRQGYERNRRNRGGIFNNRRWPF